MIECSNCGFLAAVGPEGLNCLRCKTGLIFRVKLPGRILVQTNKVNELLSSELTTLRTR